MKAIVPILLAAAMVAALVATPAVASDSNGQDFETYAVGATAPWFEPGPEFGYFSGGTVEAPGTTIDSFYQLGGSHVYYGTDIFYTNIFDAYDFDSHCCGYMVIEMRVSSRGNVLVEFFGHGWSDDETLVWPEELMDSVILSGADQHLLWGVEWGNSDITTIRWTSLDGTPFAIDDIQGAGFAIIPEPASWAMLIAGFGLIGTSLRRRRMQLA